MTCHASVGSVKNTLFFLRFSYFSCIPFVSLSFLPLVYKTSIYKLSFQLYLKAIIKIFRSGFLDFLLAISSAISKRRFHHVRALAVKSGASALKRMVKTGHYREIYEQ